MARLFRQQTNSGLVAMFSRVAIAFVACVLVSCQLFTPESTAYDAVVTTGQCDSHKNCFNSIQSALDAAAHRATSGRWHRILIKSGTYTEKVTINQPWIMLQGEGMAESKLQYSLAAANARKFHRDNWGTPGSATLTINATDVRIENLHVENNFDFLANDARSKNDPEKLADSQAVAVLLDSDSDRVEFKRVRLDAYQDTLFAHGRRAYISDSIISGNVDFIFGDGQLLIEDSDIISRVRGKQFKPGEVQGHITAASTQLHNDYGLVFINCRLLREKGVPDRSHTLGRPWHPTTNFADGRYADPDAVGYTAYINCFMDAHITAEGWGSMSGTAPDGSKSLIFTPEQSRFFESGSRGPGARGASAERTKLAADLNPERVKRELLNGWSP